MHSKNNRMNHDFQIVYFLIGDCHTADGAYALLCDLKENREDALKMVRANELRTKAKRLRAEAILGEQVVGSPEVEEARADLAEIDAAQATLQRNIAAAEAELATIEKCIAILQPMRRFAHLPDAQAHEACQREEWKLELISRAENHLITSGTIPAEQFKTMRMHPDFQTQIIPAITHVKALLLQNTAESIAELRQLDNKPRGFDLQGLLNALPNYVQGLPALEG